MKKVMLAILLALAFVGCKKEEPSMVIENNDIVLTRDKTEQLKVVGAKGAVEYSIDNKLVASVSEDGVVKGKIRGKAVVTATSSGKTATCNVEVKTLINFIPEPYLGFGESMSTVKSKIKGQGEIIIDNDEQIAQVVIINGDKFLYLYTFDSSKKLKNSGFSFDITTDTGDSVAEFLLERYLVVERIGTYGFSFLSADKKVLAILDKLKDSISTMYVYYAPMDSSKDNVASYQETLNAPAFTPIFQK